MSTTYDGLLVRGNLQDTGEIPRSGSLSACPDIIPWGQTPVGDPQSTFGSAASYGTSPGASNVITVNEQNYIYVRAKNTGTATQNGTCYLFYSLSNLLLFPSNWVQIHYGGYDPAHDTMGIGMSNVSPGSIIVTDKPFVWDRPQMPSAGNHYCLITLCSDNSESISELWQAAQGISSATGLGGFIADNGGTGWHNVTTTNTDAADFSNYVGYTGGTSEATVHFQVVCTNLPAGSSVSFSASNPNGTGSGYLPINLPWTTVPTPEGKSAGDPNPSFTTGMQTKVKQNYSSPIYYNWKSNGYGKPAGFNMTIQATVQSDGNDELKNSTTTLASIGGEDMLYYHPIAGYSYLGEASADDPFHHGDIHNTVVQVTGSDTTLVPT